VSRRKLEPGVEVSIRGERGRFRYVDEHITSTGRVVMNFVGGAPGRECFRSFYPDRVQRVHRVNKTRANHRQESQT
jgi:hypothetical protein